MPAMARRLLLCLAVSLIVATPAAGDDIHRRKAEVDQHLSSLHSKITRAKSQESVLTQEISIVNGKIDALQGDVDQAQSRLDTLEAQLAESQRRLDRVTALVKVQTQKLAQLRRDYGVALGRLRHRIIDAYETPDVNTIDVVLAARSMSSMLNDIEYFAQIGKQDKHISDDLFSAKKAMFAARQRTRKLRAQVAADTAAIKERTDQQHTVTAQLISSQEQLATARSSKRDTLSSIKVNEHEFVAEASALQSQSAALAAKIQAAEAAAAARAASTPSAPSAPSGSSGSGQPSASGFIWPVNGPITSPFGSRCLGNGDCSSHPGIDIGVPAGTPIHAAASGTVIYAGWMSGYGNLTVIDHGRGLATAYGHQSSISVGLGTTVSQGQVIGYVGCTGYCFGAHLHFEVRVNGSPVDPLGYL
jgi:murein DD-endopeptidase MepM/ murein hydrolase activator NlpD